MLIDVNAHGFRELPHGDHPEWVISGPQFWQVTDGNSCVYAEPVLPRGWANAVLKDESWEEDPSLDFDENECGDPLNFIPTHARPAKPEERA